MTGLKEIEDINEIVDIKDFLVKVLVEELNIRKGPGTGFSIAGTIRDRGVYTITHTNAFGTWGKLKSGLGWISLAKGYVKRL